MGRVHTAYFWLQKIWEYHSPGPLIRRRPALGSQSCGRRFGHHRRLVLHVFPRPFRAAGRPQIQGRSARSRGGFTNCGCQRTENREKRNARVSTTRETPHTYKWRGHFEFSSSKVGPPLSPQSPPCWDGARTRALFAARTLSYSSAEGDGERAGEQGCPRPAANQGPRNGSLLGHC